MHPCRPFVIIAALCAVAGCSIGNDAPGFRYPENSAAVDDAPQPTLGPTADLVVDSSTDTEDYETSLRVLSGRAAALRARAAALQGATF